MTNPVQDDPAVAVVVAGGRELMNGKLLIIITIRLGGIESLLTGIRATRGDDPPPCRGI